MGVCYFTTPSGKEMVSIRYNGEQAILPEMMSYEALKRSNPDAISCGIEQLLIWNLGGTYSVANELLHYFVENVLARKFH